VKSLYIDVAPASRACAYIFQWTRVKVAIYGATAGSPWHIFTPGCSSTGHGLYYYCGFNCTFQSSLCSVQMRMFVEEKKKENIFQSSHNRDYRDDKWQYVGFSSLLGSLK
jgi:hypothetical protein